MRTYSMKKREERRGVVLLIVVGLLALFTTVAISFAIVSKVESQGALNFKLSSQGATGSIPVDVNELFRLAAVQLCRDTTRLNSALRGHSILRDMYGAPMDYDNSGNPVMTFGADPTANGDVNRDGVVNAGDQINGQVIPYWGAFNGPGLFLPRPNPTLPLPPVGSPVITLNDIRDYTRYQKTAGVLTGTQQYFGFSIESQVECQYPINYVLYLPAGTNLGTRIASTAQEVAHRHPEQFWDGTTTHYMGADEDYDAPDINNMFLALERADGMILIPSFIRPQWYAQLEQVVGEFTNDHPTRAPQQDPFTGNNTVGLTWLNRINGRKVILRPRELEVNARVVDVGNRTDRWRDLVDVDGDGLIGATPMELDVDTDGDGLKDAIWIDLGLDPVQLSDGSYVKPLFAFKVIDLDSKINLNAHGRYLATESDTNNDGTTENIRHTELHPSNLGSSQAEVNPKHGILAHHFRADPMNPLTFNATAPLPPFHWRKEDPMDTNDLLGPTLYRRMMVGGGKYNTPGSTSLDDRPGANNVDDDQLDAGPYTNRYKEPWAPYSGLIDFHGSGVEAMPFESLASWTGIVAPADQYRNLMPSTRNYYYYGSNDWFAATNTGLRSLAPATQDDMLLSRDEAEEIDLYSTVNTNDWLFSLNDLERILRYEDLDATSLSSRLTTLLDVMFGNPTVSPNLSLDLVNEERYARQKMRRLFTTQSWDINRFNMPPFVTASSDPLPGPPAGSEDHADITPGDARHYGVFRGANEPVGIPYFPQELRRGYRLDLNRKLTQYPVAPDADQSKQADLDRTNLARDIYILLYMINRPDQADPARRLAQARTLAQIAVNIVDMRDTDDVMTALYFDENLLNNNQFQWNAPNPPTRDDAAHWVFGFELPKVVVSEAVAVVWPYTDVSDPLNPIGKENCFVFTELHNPWETTSGGVTLPAGQVDLAARTPSGYPVYKLQYTISNPPADAPNNTTTIEEDFLLPNPTGKPTIIDPRGGANNFYLVGPDAPPATPPNSIAVNEIINNWDDPNDNDYTSTRATITRDDTADAQISVSVMRLRNPYADPKDPDLDPMSGYTYPTTPAPPYPYHLTDFNEVVNPPWDDVDLPLNPYIEIDHVTVGRGTTNGLGSYKINPVTGMPAIDDRLSLARQQAWQGDDRVWNPNTATTITPLPALGNLEDFYFGPPKASTTKRTRSGFVDSPGAGGNTLADNKANSIADLQNYGVTFPFLNRDYATPLEVMYVRLYGSHYWEEKPLGPSDFHPARTWRMRFTDDFEFDPTSATPRLLRDRRIPWLEDNRLIHPADLGGTTYLPLADLFRFFEFVECHNRFNGAVGMGDKINGPTGSDPTGTAPFPPTPPDGELSDVAGRKHRVAGKLNLNTITEEEPFRALIDEPQAMPAQRADLNGNPIPGQPDQNGDQIMQRIPTLYYNPNSTLYNDWNWRKSLLNRELLNSQTTFPPTIYFGRDNPAGPFQTVLMRRMWPGIDASLNQLAPDILRESSYSDTLPGRSPFEQVHSEMFRQFLLSRAGRDGIYGTGDDRPFRSFAAPRLSDTILRQRNISRLDFPEGEPVGAVPGGQGEYVQIPATTGPGHWTPRLFDPVINPLPEDALAGRIAAISAANPADPTQTGPLDVTGFPDQAAIDIWMLERERNKLLAKIAGNTTTRSNVFAVWVTVGFFVVEPGTESSNVPCLNEELGIDSGTNVRHRAFFIVDRTKATKYDGPADGPSAPAPTPTIDAMDELVLPNKISVIE